MNLYGLQVASAGHPYEQEGGGDSGFSGGEPKQLPEGNRQGRGADRIHPDRRHLTGGSLDQQDEAAGPHRRSRRPLRPGLPCPVRSAAERGIPPRRPLVIKKGDQATMRYPTVFQPCRIGGLTLKNRLAMSQMTMNFATEDGHVTDKLIAHYRERAKGGVGLIFVEGTYFTPEGKGYVRQLGISSDRARRGAQTADRCRPRAEERHPDLSPDPPRRRPGLVEDHRPSTRGPLGRPGLSGGGDAAGADARRDRAASSRRMSRRPRGPKRRDSTAWTSTAPTATSSPPSSPR